MTLAQRLSSSCVSGRFRYRSVVGDCETSDSCFVVISSKCSACQTRCQQPKTWLYVWYARCRCARACCEVGIHEKWEQSVVGKAGRRLSRLPRRVSFLPNAQLAPGISAMSRCRFYISRLQTRKVHAKPIRAPPFLYSRRRRRETSHVLDSNFNSYSGRA